MENEKCESCDDVGYLEVTIEQDKQENQWCQNCIIIEPDYDPPKSMETDIHSELEIIVWKR